MSRSKKLHKALSELSKKIELQFPGLNNSRWVALRLLEGDPDMIEAVKNGKLRSLATENQLSAVSS